MNSILFDIFYQYLTQLSLICLGHVVMKLYMYKASYTYPYCIMLPFFK